GPTAGCGLARPAERLVGRLGEAVDVADVEAPPGAGLVDLDREADPVVHRDRQRLGAAHAPEPGGQDDVTRQRPAEVLPGELGEGLEGALEDALRPDVDPGPGGHLAIHHQALALELAEDVPRRPL